MKINTIRSYKLAMLSVVVCAAMVALGQNASAAPNLLPPTVCHVPDAGATVMLLGVAFGALGMAGRVLRR